MEGGRALTWSREQLEARLLRAAFNAWLCLELTDWDDSGITLGLVTRADMLGHAALNALHGGVLAAVVDAGCSMAVMARTGASVFTVDMRVDYLRPATAARFAIRGEVVRLGRTLATADARVLTPEGTLVASGRALMQHVPASPAPHQAPRP